MKGVLSYVLFFHRKSIVLAESRKDKVMEPYIPSTANSIKQMGFGELLADVNHVNTKLYKDGVYNTSLVFIKLIIIKILTNHVKDFNIVYVNQ
jgi:hypothetical protein